MAKGSLKTISTKKKKPDLKPMPQRKSSAARILEEKHVGVEITDFTYVKNLEEAESYS